MNTKKEIDNLVHEYFGDLVRGKADSKSYNRKIYLTDKDYVEVSIFHVIGSSIMISLYLDNRKYAIVSAGGYIGNPESVWRRFRYRFKRTITEQAMFVCDEKFVTKLKEVYSLL